MNAGKYKNLCAATVFSLLELIFLFHHFSPAGCVCAAAVLLYDCVVSLRASEKSPVSARAGSYLSSLLLGLLGIYCFSCGIPQKGPAIILNAGGWMGVILLALLPILLYFATNHPAKTGNGLGFTVKYLILGGITIGLANLFIQWTDWSLVLSVAAFLLIFIVIDRVGIQSSQQSSGAYLGAIAVLYLFDGIAYIAPAISISILDSIRNFECLPPFSWYDTVVVSAVLVAGMAATRYFDCKAKSGTDKAKTSSDARLYLVMLADVLCTVIAALVYTKYTPLFFLGMFLLNIFVFLGPGGDNIFRLFGAEIHTKDAFFTAAAAAILILQTALYFGWMTPCLFFILCVVGACFLRETKKGVTGWLYWQYLITASAVLVAILVSLWFNTSASYVAIASIFGIATVVLVSLHLQNPLHKLPALKWKRIAIIGATVWMLSAGCRFGAACHFKIVSEDDASRVNSITVSLNARGTENAIAQCGYHWEDDVKSDEVNLADSSDFILPARNGELCVTVTDRYGVKSNVYRWFHDYKTATPYQCGELKDNSLQG